MRIGFLRFSESSQLEIASKCLVTLRSVSSSTRWTFGNVDIELDDVKVITEEIARSTLQVLAPGDNLVSLSAEPKSSDSYTTVQFAIFNQRTSSSVRIHVNDGGTQSDRVAKCHELMMSLVPVWQPESAYIADFELMKSQCPHLKGVFPSGYSIYRKGSVISEVPFENSDMLEKVDCETGSCLTFRQQFMDTRKITCEHFEQMIEMAGGIDDKFTVLV